MKKSIQEAKAVIPSMEFTQWMLYLEMEEERHTKQDYYLAQIAAEVRRPNIKNPSKLQVEDMLLKFEKRDRMKKEVSVETMTANHKQFWMASVGLKSDGIS